jgi:hypothetical protein
MRIFMTRVVLHNGEEHYNKLHEEMEAEGFSRTVYNLDDKKRYQLPHAEYYKAGSDSTTKLEVRNSAKTAAARALKDTKDVQYSILTTGPDGCAGHNLQEVK